MSNAARFVRSFATTTRSLLVGPTVLLTTLSLSGGCAVGEGGVDPDAFEAGHHGCAPNCPPMATHGHRDTDQPPHDTSGDDGTTGSPPMTSTGGSASDGAESSGDTDDTEPPMADTMCGDWVCQGFEDIDTCPFDCVPYTVAPMGQGVGKICERDFTGFTPITEIGTGLYLGQAQGGLYPGGSNERPAAHTNAGIATAQTVGQGGGDVCLISIGMSNTYQKWQMFMTQGIAGVANLNPALRVANGAVGSNPVDTTADPNNGVWNSIDNQIAGSGCTPDEVQVVWMLHAERGPTQSFIVEADRYYDDLRATAINLADHFPNLQMIYLSSRSYAGYSDRDNNPEPYAHQGAFVVKWLIEAQIDGSDPAIALGSGFPWMAWGPYLWSDGQGADRAEGGVPGRLIPDDGMEYLCDDFAADGIHPGMGMRTKVTAQLVDFFTSDPTATPWFLQ
ncbi:MAG: hypothetical protein K0V04_33290 [Deltaproteobacteria bacterium]|nr:hypothetical protein [Deltaproteobacteria bacterium]